MPGLNEYDMFFVVDPTSFFTAQAIEYDRRTGRFLFPLSDAARKFIDDDLKKEYVLARAHSFNIAKESALARGQMPPVIGRTSSRPKASRASTRSHTGQL